MASKKRTTYTSKDTLPLAETHSNPEAILRRTTSGTTSKVSSPIATSSALLECVDAPHIVAEATDKSLRDTSYNRGKWRPCNFKPDEPCPNRINKKLTDAEIKTIPGTYHLPNTANYHKILAQGKSKDTQKSQPQTPKVDPIVIPPIKPEILDARHSDDCLQEERPCPHVYDITNGNDIFYNWLERKFQDCRLQPCPRRYTPLPSKHILSILDIDYEVTTKENRQKAWEINRETPYQSPVTSKPASRQPSRRPSPSRNIVAASTSTPTTQTFHHGSNNPSGSGDPSPPQP
ncbi:hypothetical protein CPB83DRAFT_897647, partial [Crepidotus variabilis]